MGTNATNSGPVPKKGDGIRIDNSSESVVGGIGGATSGQCTGACNVIASNKGAGVFVTGLSAKNELRANSIFKNDELGIDLGALGVTANDPGDPDTGPNGLANFPAGVTASYDAARTRWVKPAAFVGKPSAPLP